MEIHLSIWVQKYLSILTENDAMKLYLENTSWTFRVNDKQIYF